MSKTVTAGSTGVEAIIFAIDSDGNLVDSLDGADFLLRYLRDGEDPVSIPTANVSEAGNGAYAVVLPNAATAAGSTRVIIFGTTDTSGGGAPLTNGPSVLGDSIALAVEDGNGGASTTDWTPTTTRSTEDSPGPNQSSELRFWRDEGSGYERFGWLLVPVDTDIATLQIAFTPTDVAPSNYAAVSIHGPLIDVPLPDTGNQTTRRDAAVAKGSVTIPQPTLAIGTQSTVDLDSLVSDETAGLSMLFLFRVANEGGQGPTGSADDYTITIDSASSTTGGGSSGGNAEGLTLQDLVDNPIPVQSVADPVTLTTDYDTAKTAAYTATDRTRDDAIASRTTETRMANLDGHAAAANNRLIKINALIDYVDDLESRIPSNHVQLLSDLQDTVDNTLTASQYVDHSADVAAIKTQTDKLDFVANRLQTETVSIIDDALRLFATRDLGTVTVAANSVATYSQGGSTGTGGDVNVVSIGGETITPTMATAFGYFFDQSSPSKRVNDVGTGGGGASPLTSADAEGIRERLNLPGTQAAGLPDLVLDSNTVSVAGTAVGGVADFKASGFSTFDPSTASVTIGSFGSSTLTAAILASVRGEVASELANRNVTAGRMTNLDATVSSRSTLTQSQTQTAARAAIDAYDPPTAAETAAEATRVIDRGDIAWLTGSGGSGGSGEADWTPTERAQIRHRIGIDGATEEPSTNSPNLPVTVSSSRVIDVDNQSTPGAAGHFTITQLSDYETGGEVRPVGPIRIETALNLAAASSLKFGATRKLGGRFADPDPTERIDANNINGTARAEPVTGQTDQYDLFIDIDSPALAIRPGEFGWDVDALFDDDSQPLVHGTMTLRQSMGNREGLTPAT